MAVTVKDVIKIIRAALAAQAVASKQVGLHVTNGDHQ